MSALDWFPAAARAAGLDVYEMSGWKTRQTRPGFSPLGVVCHHTATSTGWLDGHVAALLRDGRRDLAGPLAQFGLERDGTIVLIAGGRCNHNGFGLWANDSYGIEAYNDGVGEPWPKAQLKAYRGLVAVLCAHHGWGPDRVKAHRETDPDRKIDPTGIDMPAFRAEVFAPPPAPVPQQETLVSFFSVSTGKHYSIAPWGVTELTPAQAYELGLNGAKFVKVTLSTWKTLVSGAPR